MRLAGAGRGRIVGVRHGTGPHHPGFLSVVCGRERQSRHPRAVQRGHAVGCAGGLHFAVGPHPGRVSGAGGHQVPSSLGRPAGGMGHGRAVHRVPVLLRADVQLAETRLGPALPSGGRPAGLRRSRAQSAVAEPLADGGAPPDAVPGLCGLHRALLLRHSGAGHRSFGRGLAGGDPPVDPVCLGLPNRRDHLGGVVVVGRSGLGRLLGMGPGGERLAAAVADRYRLSALGDGAGAPGDAAGMEPVAGMRHVRLDHFGDVLDPLWVGGLGSRVFR